MHVFTVGCTVVFYSHSSLYRCLSYSQLAVQLFLLYRCISYSQLALQLYFLFTVGSSAIFFLFTVQLYFLFTVQWYFLFTVGCTE